MPEVRRTESEEWFARYCAGHGINVLAYEPDLGVATRPDYLIERGGSEVVCEVKEFTATRFDRMIATARLFSSSESEELKPVRNQVRHAARNLKPLEGSKWPLAIVLANPLHLHVPLEPERLIHALYGDLTVTFEVGPEGPVTEPEWVAGRSGRLRSDHPYISAVVALHEGEREADWWRAWHESYGPATAKTTEEAIERAMARTAAADRARQEEEIPAGTYYRVDVVHNWSDTATPLPEGVFGGERDTAWAFDGERSFAQVR